MRETVHVGYISLIAKVTTTTSPNKPIVIKLRPNSSQ